MHVISKLSSHLPGANELTRCSTCVDIGGSMCYHADVIKWNQFPRYWPFVRGIHRSLLNSPHKGQWCGALIYSLICAWINGWVNNGEAGNLRRHRFPIMTSLQWHCDDCLGGMPPRGWLVPPCKSEHPHSSHTFCLRFPVTKQTSNNTHTCIHTHTNTHTQMGCQMDIYTALLDIGKSHCRYR